MTLIKVIGINYFLNNQLIIQHLYVKMLHVSWSHRVDERYIVVKLQKITSRAKFYSVELYSRGMLQYSNVTVVECYNDFPNSLW